VPILGITAMGGTRTTRTDDAPRGRKRQVAVLVRVLSYDALVEAPTTDGAWLAIPEVGRLTLGRAPTEASAAGPLTLLTSVDAALDDAFVSTRHAVIRRGETDVLSDLDSRNGTFVNGEAVRDYPLSDGDLIEIGHTLLCYRKVEPALLPLLGRRRFGPTLTFSPRLLTLCEDLARIAPSREPVLLLAESGAGKEEAAKMIHELSGRRGELVTLDGGAVPDGLFEATLLGHVRGAFTGATGALKGALVRADRGTLFLDEVANLSAASQAKLLRVWESESVTPVGGESARPVDVRWIAATNGRLDDPDGTFRDDLRQRMAGFVARIPPLRGRREDLGRLTSFLLEDAGVARLAIAPEAGRALFHRPFPGNVRELRKVLRSAALLARAGRIEVGQVGEQRDEPFDSSGRLSKRAERDSSAAPGEERSRVEAALRSTQGNVVRAAQLLGTHPRQVYRHIARHGLDLATFRAR
jgi:sigma-54 dependent transcriptional regulator, acetoin dehydrogenase operon transcriptional activator AcoR